MNKLVFQLVILSAILALPLSAAAYVAVPYDPGIWDAGPGAVVTYSFASTDYTTYESEADDGGIAPGYIVPLDDFMPSGARHQIELAFDAWESVADITFLEVADGGGPFGNGTSGAIGNIRLGGHWMDGSSSTLAHGYYPPDNGGTAAGDIHFDIAENWVIGFDGDDDGANEGSSDGFDIFTVALHEIGHAIGLEHSTVPGARMTKNYTEAFSGLGEDDIAGAQYLYGEPENVTPTPVPAPSGAWLYLLAVAGLLFLFARRGRGPRYAV